MARKSRYVAEAESVPKAAFKTAAYIRRSAEDAGEGFSVENQTLLVKSYIGERPEFELAGVFTDNGKTGTNFERPGFEAMMDEIRRGKINCIVVKDLSRFGRDYIEAGNFIETVFPRLGVRFVAIGDGFDSFDPRCQSDGMSVALKNTVNAFYAKDISAKIRTAKRVKQEKGDFIGAMPPYGYIKNPENKNRLIIDEEAASVVRYIFARRLCGMSANAIAIALNESGVPAPHNYFYIKGIFRDKRYEKPHYWAGDAIGRILRNMAYIGHTALGKYKAGASLYSAIAQPKDRWIVTKNTHAPIVSETDFDAVQALLLSEAEKRGARTKYTHPDKILSGYIFCAECGHAVSRTGYRTKNGFKYHYTCAGCKRKAPNRAEFGYIPEDVLIETVRIAVMRQTEVCADMWRLAEDFMNAAPAKRRKREAEETLRTLQADSARLPAKSMRLYDDFCDGLVSEDTYRSLHERLDAEQAAVSARIDVLTSEIASLTEMSLDENAFVREFSKFSGEAGLTRELLAALVDRIEVTKDLSVHIKFRYADEYERLAKRISRDERSFAK
jgi:DNA invertase Pin-like site-specific DNA recombinase